MCPTWTLMDEGPPRYLDCHGRLDVADLGLHLLLHVSPQPLLQGLYPVLRLVFLAVQLRLHRVHVVL